MIQPVGSFAPGGTGSPSDGKVGGSGGVVVNSSPSTNTDVKAGIGGYGHPWE